MKKKETAVHTYLYDKHVQNKTLAISELSKHLQICIYSGESMIYYICYGLAMQIAVSLVNMLEHLAKQNSISVLHYKIYA